jgi:hypothetical protein
MQIVVSTDDENMEARKGKGVLASFWTVTPRQGANSSSTMHAATTANRR